MHIYNQRKNTRNMHIHKSTKMETVICKQKTSKTKNAQPKQIKIKATEFDLCWSSIAGPVVYLPTLKCG